MRVKTEEAEPAEKKRNVFDPFKVKTEQVEPKEEIDDPITDEEWQRGAFEIDNAQDSVCVLARVS